MTKITKQQWASYPPIPSYEHEDIVRELMGYAVLCPTCCILETDPYTGRVEEKISSCALHWSRVFEWPWAILNGELNYQQYVLDAAGGHAPLQYALAKRAGVVCNVDLNKESLDAVDKYRRKNKVHDLHTFHHDIVGQTRYHSFNRVFCISVIEHIPDYEKAISELLRVLKPEGILILTMDVVINRAATELFCIDTVKAKELVESLGGVFEVPEGGLLMNKMPSGEILSCLCLKILKG